MKIIEKDKKIIENKKISKTNIYRMVIEEIKNKLNPGEFVNLSIPNVYLPRPISVADFHDEKLTLIYRVVGEGTNIMSQMSENDTITLLTGLGNGFDIKESESPLVIGGGLGVAPLYYLTKTLKEKGMNPKVILGFANKEDSFYLREYQDLVGYFNVTYDSEGKLVTDVMNDIYYDYFYTCGPKPMLKAVEDISKTDGELSLESRMACGIGICKCCSQKTEEGMKTLCKDGPVLKKGMIRW